MIRYLARLLILVAGLLLLTAGTAAAATTTAFIKIACPFIEAFVTNEPTVLPCEGEIPPDVTRIYAIKALHGWPYLQTAWGYVKCEFWHDGGTPHHLHSCIDSLDTRTAEDRAANPVPPGDGVPPGALGICQEKVQGEQPDGSVCTFNLPPLKIRGPGHKAARGDRFFVNLVCVTWSGYAKCGGEFWFQVLAD
jgi:hypothetical protein